MSDWGDDQVPLGSEADETTVKEMVDAGCEKQTILSVKAFLVIAIPPRLAMASSEMNWIIDVGDPAMVLNLHHTLLK